MSSRKSEILHFDGLFLAKSCKVSAEKGSEELSLMTLKSDGKFKEKQSGGFKCYKFGKLSPSHSKVFFFFLMCSFCPKNKGFELQKHRSFFFHGTIQWSKIGINPDLVASEMAWEIGEHSLEHSNVWKIVLSLAPFVQSIQNFRRKRISHDTEEWWPFVPKITWEICWILKWAVASLKICTLMCYCFWKYDWLVLRKMNWGIWRILTQCSKVSKLAL